MNESKIIYRVNREKQVVTCTITGCRYIALNRILKYAPSSYPGCMGKRFEIRDSYTGVAKCAPEDTWDEEYGKKLALLRAKQKRGYAINIRIKRFIDIIKAETDALIKHGLHDIPKEI